jgi:hypothetical protein
LAQWSLCRTTGLIRQISQLDVLSKNSYIHAVGLGHVPDVQRGRDGSEDGRLLLVVGKPLARKVGASALRDLQDDRSLDIPIADI